MDRSKKITNTKQFELLVEIMQKNPDIAKGFGGFNMAKRDFKIAWNEYSVKLNSLGPPTRDGDGWLKVWSDYKNKIKKKMQHNKKELRATGGGENKLYHFSVLETSVIDLLTLEKVVEPNGKEFGLASSINIQGCSSTAHPDCMRCNIDGCIKCPIFLVQDTRLCVKLCPSGYIDQWSSSPDFMGRICINQGLSSPLLATITGLIAGFFVCFTLLIIAIILIKRKRRRTTIKKKLINENTIDRNDFLIQLNDMRPNAEYFLAMLNDTRRQIRKLYLSGESAAANSYRPIVRDLAKILILLNRPIELIPSPPHDWNRIYNWSEQALDRYKPKIGQLIDFFQGPSPIDHHNHHLSKNHNIDYQINYNNGNSHTNNDNDDQRRNFSSQYHQHQQQQKIQLFGSLISLHEFDEPRPSDPFGSSFNTLKGNLISDLNTSSLWLEDEFFKLGFRPQDEITTEL